VRARQQRARRALRWPHGKREAAFRTPFAGFPAAFGGALFLGDAGQLARLDPATGRMLWRTRIDHVGPRAAANGLLWVEARDRRGDRVVSIDPRNGRIVSSVHVGEFGAMWLERVGSELWMTTAGGHVVIVRP
jgi:outer membrane protein assembly factor BamB